MHPKKLCMIFLVFLLLFSNQTLAQGNKLSLLKSPIIFKGNDTIAYRDPAILFHEDVFHLFFTLVRSEDGRIYSYTASSRSKDLIDWSPVRIITPKDQNLNFCSPGNVIRWGQEWILCLQTYPRPGLTDRDPTRYGSQKGPLHPIQPSPHHHGCCGTPIRDHY